MTTVDTTHESGKVWGIILAAGEGTRLRGFGAGSAVLDRPKQFCVFDGGPTLLGRALSRALMLTSIDRVVPVVRRDHQHWWRPELTALPPHNVVVQPCNKGTGCGLLLPLVHVLLRDPHAVVVVLPSDHLVEHEQVLARAARKGIEAVREHTDSAVLLGIQPEEPDSDLGWIAPSMTSDRGLRAVLSFVEKPSAEVAERMKAAGGLVNSLVLVCRGLTLLSMCERVFPGVVERFAAALVCVDRDDRERRIVALYDRLPTLDLSRDLLQSHATDLRVIPVPPCGWADLGTPGRLIRRARGIARTAPPHCGLPGGPPDLAQLASLASGPPPDGSRATAG
jgi:mannose-1-phosphate guanylyltransferase